MKPSRISHWLLALLLVGGFFALAVAEEPVLVRAGSVDATPTSIDAPLSTRCTIRQDSSGCWFVCPKGEPFFSLGVCMFNQGSDIADYAPARPSYTALRHYASDVDWADASLQRLKSWRFTTVGGWSDYRALAKSREHDLWITPVLHLGSRTGLPWFDMWDEKNIRRVEEIAAETISPVRDDPRVLGYYSDNELGWWNAILWKMTLQQPASSGQRQRLIALVREIYADDWAELVHDFEPQNAADWLELESRGMLWLRPGAGGIRTIRRFLGLAAGRYYELMRATIRKFDPDALYLGDRYQSFYYPELAAASRPHVDVVSTNFNTSWNDGTFVRWYFDTLHELTGKPVIASEFYMSAEENRSGNPNEVGGFPIVTTQAERAEALSNTLRGLLRLPYVVGADWFQYYDEPPHGRKLDGEDYNFGLVDIHDEPYEEVTAAFASIDHAQVKSRPAARPANALAGVPPAPDNPLVDFRVTTALKHWDRERGFVPPATPQPMADLYIAWTPTAVYLATYALDIVENDYYRDGKIPTADLVTWTIRPRDAAPITIRTGAGKDPLVSDPALRIQSLSGLYHNIRCITAIALPARSFGKTALKPGDQITFDSTYTTHARADRIEWKGTFTLAE
jgi:hypothetical protein